MNSRFLVKDICTIAVCAALIFAQEYVLMGIPNVQFTFALIIVFSVHFKFPKAFLIALTYVVVDSMMFVSMYTPVLIVAMTMLPVIVCFIKKFTKSYVVFAIVALIYAFIFSWMFALFNVVFMDYTLSQLTAYLIVDIPFEITLAVSNFISTFLIFVPLTRTLKIVDSDNELRYTKEKNTSYIYTLNKSSKKKLKGVDVNNESIY